MNRLARLLVSIVTVATLTVAAFAVPAQAQSRSATWQGATAFGWGYYTYARATLTINNVLINGNQVMSQVSVDDIGQLHRQVDNSLVNIRAGGLWVYVSLSWQATPSSTPVNLFQATVANSIGGTTGVTDLTVTWVPYGTYTDTESVAANINGAPGPGCVGWVTYRSASIQA